MAKGPLKELRKQLEFTQAELAAALGISTSQYNRAEKGYAYLPPRAWERFAELGMPVGVTLTKQQKFVKATTEELRDRIRRSLGRTPRKGG